MCCTIFLQDWALANSVPGREYAMKLFTIE